MVRVWKSFTKLSSRFLLPDYQIIMYWIEFNTRKQTKIEQSRKYDTYIALRMFNKTEWMISFWTKWIIERFYFLKKCSPNKRVPIDQKSNAGCGKRAQILCSKVVGYLNKNQGWDLLSSVTLECSVGYSKLWVSFVITTDRLYALEPF